jgi:hypothetical protein
MVIALTPSPNQDELQVELSISTRLSLSADQARRKATRFLMDNVSMFLMPVNPLLVIIDHEQIQWRFSVMLAMGQQGRLGQVGELNVDAYTGDILVDEAALAEIKENAQRLAQSATYTTVG